MRAWNRPRNPGKRPAMTALLCLCLTSTLSWGAQPASTGTDKALPLTPERHVEFTADEGTWVSLDVSPDGKSVAFDLMGHIYTMPIEGGAAKAITTGWSFDAQPRFSPDGKHIVYVTDRGGDDNLWIMDADGSNPRAITKADNTMFVSPVWSKNGEYIVVSQKKPHFYKSAFELWMYDVNGGSGVRITESHAVDSVPSTQWHNALGATLSPDGRYVYYARKFGYFSTRIKFPLWQIARRDLKTGVEDVITAEGGSAIRPLLSPDGTKLVYGTRHESQTALRVRNLQTGEDKWLKFPVQRDDQETYFSSRDLLPGYAFLPGGNEILVSYGGKFHRVNVNSGADSVVPFQAVISRDLGPNLNVPYRVEQGPVHARIVQGAKISPDGKRVAFNALAKLYVMDLAGGTPRQVLSGNGRGYRPAWSPDGQWIAYASWENGDGAIWKVRADGSAAPQRLTTAPAYYTDPVWSPDSKRIVALRASNHQALEQISQWGQSIQGLDLVWIPSSGGNPTMICAAAGWSYPHFTTDADRIVATVVHSAGALAADHFLASVRWDGTERRTLVRVVGKDAWGADFSPTYSNVLSPDEQWVLVLYRNQLYLSAVPKPGGEPVTINVNAPPAALARITATGADEIGWADGGKTIVWTLGASIFELPLDQALVRLREANQAANPPKFPVPLVKTATVREVKVDVSMPRSTPQGTVVLRGARVITMRGDEVIPAADIVVTNNRITAVGATGSAAVPAGAKIVDVKGKTIVPGYIDTHAHWTEVRRGVLDMQNWGFLTTLAYGITTGRDPQTSTNDVFVYQDLADAGVILGPRAYSTGPGIFWVNDFKSVDEAVDVASRYKDYYRTHLIKSYMVGNRTQRQYMVEACKRLKLIPTTEGAAELPLDLTHAIDGFSGNEHQFPIAPLYKDVTEFVARSGLFYTPTFIIEGYGGPGTENYYYETTNVHNDPKVRHFVPYEVLASKDSRITWFRPDEYAYPSMAQGAADILKSGGKVCIGGHGQFQGLSFHWELWSVHAGKMSNLEALRAATLLGAQAMGLDQDLGSIEAGKLADLVVLDKNPLDDIHNTTAVEYVMKNGELFEGNTLNEVWPSQKALPAMWWWNDHP